ncbi:hypothetical protein HMPREF0322_04323 [Desulfitobacterium hafniense DP7]|uniref:Uncharacterized protein n=1 Tax=Desulfitobacterium hafniense DP7 TaxID=537010 RepID=G9XTL6_DESHA|nr:hypothetical protein HMPREF0322_04323 [Desulfitobacterium hafniense DP7]
MSNFYAKIAVLAKTIGNDRHTLSVLKTGEKWRFTWYRQAIASDWFSID